MFLILILIKILTFLILFFCGCIISSRNPAHSAFSLVFVFLLNAFVLFLLNIKFLAFTIIILYAGAVSILFLFIIFTLNMKEKDQDLSILNYFIIYTSVLKLGLICMESKSLYIYKLNNIFYNLKGSDIFILNCKGLGISDLYVIGWLFYERFYFTFLFIGIILFSAMLAIILLIRPFLSEAEVTKKV